MSAIALTPRIFCVRLTGGHADDVLQATAQILADTVKERGQNVGVSFISISFMLYLSLPHDLPPGITGDLS